MPDAGPAVNPSEPRRFRPSLGWVLAQQLTAMSIGLGLIYGIGMATGVLPPPRLLAASASLTAMTLGTVLTAAGLVWRMTVTPRPDGLAAARLVGRPAVAAWDDVTSVRPRTMFLTPQLLLTVRGWDQPLVLTLRLDDLRGFAEAVAEFAGSDHPLTVALHERLTGG